MRLVTKQLSTFIKILKADLVCYEAIFHVCLHHCHEAVSMVRVEKVWKTLNVEDGVEVKPFCSSVSQRGLGESGGTEQQVGGAVDRMLAHSKAHVIEEA